jgi:zinc and cadmium transporter
MVDLKLGVVAALAVLAHEVPHHMGDLVVLREGSQSRQTAVLKVSLAGAITALGGLTGYALLDQLHGVLPYMLAIASSSFIYVALADLIPQLQKRLSSRETAAQIVWLLCGIGLVSAVSVLAHSFILHVRKAKRCLYSGHHCATLIASLSLLRRAIRACCTTRSSYQGTSV